MSEQKWPRAPRARWRRFHRRRSLFDVVECVVVPVLLRVESIERRLDLAGQQSSLASAERIQHAVTAGRTAVESQTALRALLLLELLLPCSGEGTERGWCFRSGLLTVVLDAPRGRTEGVTTAE